MLLCGCMMNILIIASNLMEAFFYVLSYPFLYLLAANPNTEILIIVLLERRKRISNFVNSEKEKSTFSLFMHVWSPFSLLFLSLHSQSWIFLIVMIYFYLLTLLILKVFKKNFFFFFFNSITFLCRLLLEIWYEYFIFK